MAITYPTTVDAFPPIGTDVNTNDTVGSRTHRDMHNDLGDAVVAIETELGVNPSGAFATVAARLTASDSRVTRPNTDDVLVEVYDVTNTRWQVTHYDSGWRDVSSSASGLTGTDILARVRRIGHTVHYKLYYTQTGAASGVTVLNAAGFLPTAPTLYVPIYSAALGAGTPSAELTASAVKIYSAAGANGGNVTAGLTWATSDALPTSLPGTLVSAAPYA